MSNILPNTATSFSSCFPPSHFFRKRLNPNILYRDFLQYVCILFSISLGDTVHRQQTTVGQTVQMSRRHL